MRFAMENVLHVRYSAAKRQFLTPLARQTVFSYERDERFFSTHDFVREVRHFLARRGSNTAKLDILHERYEGFL